MNLPVKTKHILILTGEPSGDIHASHLVKNLRQTIPNVYISGIGGQFLENEGVDLFFHIENLSAMGITEILMQLGHIKKAFDLFKNKLRTHQPDLIILIDYPGFNLKAAQYVKERYPVKILYYITPKVWAWKKSRLKKIKKFVDHAALIFPFEEKLYNKYKIPCTYVGNPLIDQYPETLSKPFLRNRKKKAELRPFRIGLLPGSRKNEIQKLLDIMARTCILINRYYPNTVYMISRAISIDQEYLDEYLKTYSDKFQYKIIDGDVKDVLSESDLVIAASGTVTLEAALCCVPTIIIYKMSYISYKIAKLFVKIKYAGLANIIVNKEVMPELLQEQATPEKISKKALYMLEHLQKYEDKLMQVRLKLGKSGASKRAANIALAMTKR